MTLKSACKDPIFYYFDEILWNSIFDLSVGAYLPGMF